MIDWKEVKSYDKPREDGYYLVSSTWGVRVASFMKDFGNNFQDVISNQDEGMPDWSGIFNCEFYVSHWCEMPSAPKQENVCEHKNTFYSKRWGEHTCSDCGESVQCINSIPVGIENW